MIWKCGGVVLNLFYDHELPTQYAVLYIFAIFQRDHHTQFIKTVLVLYTSPTRMPSIPTQSHLFCQKYPTIAAFWKSSQEGASLWINDIIDGLSTADFTKAWNALVYSGLPWFTMFCLGLSWSKMICHGLPRFVMVSLGLPWSFLVCLDLPMSSMI